MEQILKTTMLEYEKSIFHIQLATHQSGKQYISIRQTIEDTNTDQQLKINPTVAADLIKTLTEYLTHISQSYLTEQKQEQLIKSYYTGVPLEHLAIQYNCTTEIIQQILLNKGIEIVDNKMPAHLIRGRRNKTKR